MHKQIEEFRWKKIIYCCCLKCTKHKNDRQPFLKKVLSYLAECKVSKSNYGRTSNNVRLAPRKPNIIARRRELNCCRFHFQESNGRLCATFKIENCVSSTGCPLGERLTKLRVTMAFICRLSWRSRTYSLCSTWTLTMGLDAPTDGA